MDITVAQPGLDNSAAGVSRPSRWRPCGKAGGDRPEASGDETWVVAAITTLAAVTRADVAAIPAGAAVTRADAAAIPAGAAAIRAVAAATGVIPAAAARTAAAALA